MVFIKIPGYFHLIPSLDMFLDHVSIMRISVAPLNEVCTVVNHDFCGSNDDCMLMTDIQIVLSVCGDNHFLFLFPLVHIN